MRQKIDRYLPNMYFILEYRYLEMDNNTTEISIKPFVIGIKNWLFSKNPKGDHTTTTVYRIIETTKANNLIDKMYLSYIFDKMTGIDDFSNFDVEVLIPWASKIPYNVKNLK